MMLFGELLHRIHMLKLLVVYNVFSVALCIFSAVAAVNVHVQVSVLSFFLLFFRTQTDDVQEMKNHHLTSG